MRVEDGVEILRAPAGAIPQVPGKYPGFDAESAVEMATLHGSPEWMAVLHMNEIERVTS